MHTELRPAFRRLYYIQSEIFNVLNGSVNKYYNILILYVICILNVELVIAFRRYMVKALFMEPGFQFFYKPVTQAIILTARVTVSIY